MPHHLMKPKASDCHVDNESQKRNAEWEKIGS